MEGKLIKLEKSKYTLVYKEGNIAWENNPAFDGTLSLKNCEAIENGYDLDELTNRAFDNMGYHSTVTPHEEKQFKLGYRVAFREALEILGDKKFTKEDMGRIMVYGYDKSTENEYLSRIPFNEYIQSLQQTEWDVEIEMWFHGTRHKKGEWIPKLDADGCLILKRK